MNERFDGIIQFLTTWLNTNVLTAATAAQWLCAAVAQIGRASCRERVFRAV